MITKEEIHRRWLARWMNRVWDKWLARNEAEMTKAFEDWVVFGTGTVERQWDGNVKHVPFGEVTAEET